MSRSKQTPPDFEASMAELEQIVQALEQGDLSLEDSLKQFERGVQLARECQGALQAAEQRVQVLGKTPDGGMTVTDLESGEE